MTVLDARAAAAAAPRWRAWRPVLTPALGALVLLVVVLHVGAGPFVDGVRSVGPASLLTAVVVGAVTALACAVRWRAAASALGSELRLGPAVAAVYRAQLLNVVLPLGVLGDVHRGAARLREPGGPGAARAVVWERLAGLVVLGLVASAVLLVEPVGIPRAAVAMVVAGLGALVLSLRLLRRHERVRSARLVRAVADDAASIAAAPRALLVLVATSLVVVVGHALTFVVAARAAGAAVSWSVLAPLSLLVLLAMSVPTHVGGWGMREGVAAWAFAAAGLGAALGVRAAVVYAVITTVAVLPGAAVLLADRVSPRREEAAP